MEYSAQIIARLFVPKVASRRKRESDKQKEKGNAFREENNSNEAI
jgi:hypothetical protein